MNRRSNDMAAPKRIKQELKNNKALIECAEQFGLVGDPTRIKICWLLCRHPELSVGEIAGFLGVSPSLVSHALKKLKESSLVDARREHKQVFYRLSNASFSHLLRQTFSSL